VSRAGHARTIPKIGFEEIVADNGKIIDKNSASSGR
jgi:hypothetical protein